MSKHRPTSSHFGQYQTPLPRDRRCRGVVVACVLALTVPCRSSEEPVAGRAAQPAASKCKTGTEWQPLFDGKTLAGWTANGGGKWSVVNGEIIGETGDGRYGWLVTEKTFGDLILELECKHEAPGNSGIQFRSHLIGEEMYGYQAEFDPRPDANTGGVYEEKGRRWLAKPDAKGLAAMKPYKWNHYRIQAIGDHIQLAVNGVVTVDFRDCRTPSGIIALQVHSGKTAVKVRWRNIRIKDLGDGGGWTPLFDGKTLRGWHPHGDPSAWRAEKGQIVGELTEQSPYSYLATDKQFGDFELKLKMIYDSEGGNSGIFFRSSFPPHCAKCNHVALKLPADTKAFKCPKCGHTESLPYNKRVHIYGVQAEFAPPGHHTGGLYYAGGGGWINVDKVTEAMQKMYRFHQWNDLRIKAVGDHLIVHLNGFLISDVKHPPGAARGIIALQLHAGGAMKVRFKDLNIRPATGKPHPPT